MRGVLGGLATVVAVLSLANPAQAGPQSAHYARGSSDVFWFMHISDLHTSYDWNPTDEHANMEFAFGPALGAIKPWFLVATGDLVDGSPIGVPTTGQSQAEWDEYRDLYMSAGLSPSFYFDLPGNHDGYGDVGMTHYLSSSLQGKTNGATSVSWAVDTPLGSYKFFGLASAGNGSGPFSEKPEFLQSQIDALKAELAAEPEPDLLFVLAHHPITTPTNSEQVVGVMKQLGGGFYLHGHVHEYDEYTDGDPSIVANEVDSLGQKKTHNIAVGVVDHKAFAYRATGTGSPWPLVIVTAPVSRSLRGGETNPYAYTVCKDRTDNPVRAVVFGDASPSAVTVQVGTLAPVAMSPKSDPVGMWSAEVDTTALVPGGADVTVTATVGGETRSDTITTDLVAGPCDELPIDPLSTGGAAGAAGSAGAGAGGTAGTGSGGSAGVGGSAGAAGVAGAAGAAGSTSSPADESDAGGCGCRQARTPAPSARLGAFGLLSLVLLLRRRRVPRRRRAGPTNH